MINNTIYVKVEDVAKAKNVDARTIRRYCTSNKYTCRYIKSNVGRGGKQYEILLSSVEPEIQEKILKNLNAAKEAADSSIGGSSVKTIDNAPVSIITNQTQTANQQGTLSCALFPSGTTPAVVPEKAKKLALAKVDLVSHWEAYRNGQPSKAKADKEFIIGYNSKFLCPNLFEIIGNVSIKSLHRWIKDLKDNNNDYKALIPNYKYGCESVINTKMSSEEQKRLLDFMLAPNKFSVGNAYRLITYSLKREMGEDIQLSSYASYKRFVEKFKRNRFDIWTLMRGGEKELCDEVTPYIKRNPSLLEVGDVLIADGHVLDFMVKDPFNNGKPKRATIVVYQDWKSADIAGYEIMMTENTQCVAAALRNSIIRLGKMPKIAYQDNGKSFKNNFFRGTKPDFTQAGFYGLFGSLGIMPVYAWNYHGQSKPVERFFREFTQTYSSLMNSYIGNNIENRPAYLKRNEKFHKKIHNDYVPTIEETIAALEKWFEFYRSQPCPHVKGKTIGEVFNEGRGVGVDIELLDDLMMAEQTRKVRQNGIKIFGSMYFAPELYPIRDTVIVKYSLLDIYKVKVYSLLGEYICTAEAEKELHPMAGILGDGDDMYTYKQALKLKKALTKQTMKDAKELTPRLKTFKWDEKLLTKNDSKKVSEEKIQKEKTYQIDVSEIDFIENTQKNYKII